jgi:hypothetical protein
MNGSHASNVKINDVQRVFYVLSFFSITDKLAVLSLSDTLRYTFPFSPLVQVLLERYGPALCW